MVLVQQEAIFLPVITHNNLNLSRCVQGLNSAGGSWIITPVDTVQVQLSPKHVCLHAAMGACCIEQTGSFTFTLTLWVDQELKKAEVLRVNLRACCYS